MVNVSELLYTRKKEQNTGAIVEEIKRKDHDPMTNRKECKQ